MEPHGRTTIHGTRGTHQFQVQQTVNGQPSAWTGIRKFYIKPSPPRIDNPMQGSNVPVDSAVYGAFTPGATVVVQDSTGKPIAGTFIYTTGGWIFSYPWVPGEKHIKAVQTMNGQTSLPSDLRQFRLRPHTLVIQPPPVPAAAKQPLTLTGVSSGAVTLNMWNDGIRRSLVISPAPVRPAHSPRRRTGWRVPPRSRRRSL